MDADLNPETITYQQVLAMFMKNELAIEKLTKQITRNEKQLSDITDTLGKYVEEQVKPKAISEFKKFGIFLNESHFRVSNDENIGSQSYGIDLLLVNTDYAVAIECKSKLKIDDVDEHLKRLEKIKKNPTKGLRNIKLLGAVTGMIIPKNVLEYAIKKGLFVFVPTGDTVKIANEKVFKFKTWDTASL